MEKENRKEIENNKRLQEESPSQLQLPIKSQTEEFLCNASPEKCLCISVETYYQIKENETTFEKELEKFVEDIINK
jgi:hypothetical protein